LLDCAPAVNAELARLRDNHPADGHYSLRDSTVPPSGFFQANHDLRETLRGLIAAGAPAQGDHAARRLLRRRFFHRNRGGTLFKRVVAVDNDPRTLRDAHRLG